MLFIIIDDVMDGLLTSNLKMNFSELQREFFLLLKKALQPFELLFTFAAQIQGCANG